jgi:hypothetical protein
MTNFGARMNIEGVGSARNLFCAKIGKWNMFVRIVEPTHDVFVAGSSDMSFAIGTEVPTPRRMNMAEAVTWR